MTVAEFTEERIRLEFQVDLRWICRRCAYETWLDPLTKAHDKWAPCPECKETDWHTTVQPKPEV